MSEILKQLLKSVLGRFDVAVTRLSAFEELKRNVRSAHDLTLLLSLPFDHAPQLLSCLPHSKSQLRQDLFLLSQLNFKRGGFFVEFGATNGIDLSNTYLLEKQFAWTGILAEPATCWHRALRENRSAMIEVKCVWSDSNSILEFNEANTAELSTISTFSEADVHKKSRRRGKTYDVRTISLNDLLKEHSAPIDIDYLSIDTEGSEFDILANFNFDEHSFKVITCEHNYTCSREKIHQLLTKNNYKRVLKDLSEFDDWYVRLS